EAGSPGSVSGPVAGADAAGLVIGRFREVEFRPGSGLGVRPAPAPRPIRRRRGDAGGRGGLVGRHGPTKLDNLIRQHHPPQRTPTPKPDTPPGVTDQSAPRL